MVLEAENKEHFTWLRLKNAAFEDISWESQSELFSLYISYSVPVASGYWIENMYNAHKYSKITTAEELTENTAGGKYAYHSYNPPSNDH